MPDKSISIQNGITMSITTQNIKVQVPGASTSSGIPKEGEVLTFMAFSDNMKARVLEWIASGDTIVVTLTDEPVRTGEWYEPPFIKPIKGEKLKEPEAPLDPWSAFLCQFFNGPGKRS